MYRQILYIDRHALSFETFIMAFMVIGFKTRVELEPCIRRDNAQISSDI